MSVTVTGGSATATGGSASSSSYSSVTIQQSNHQFQCPEIDPASTVAAITFLISVVLVIRGRKMRKA